jgi:hypothetical protein
VPDDSSKPPPPDDVLSADGVTADGMTTDGPAGPPDMPMTPIGSPTLPPLPDDCPEIATGLITVLGQQVQLYVGPPGLPGPMVFYWHGTGSNPSEAIPGLAGGLSEVQKTGGVVASFSTTTGTGQNTGNGVWYTGDFAMADIILACALDQGLVDPRQVFTAGCSAGGLQASAMVFERSSYLAGAMPNSGGTVFSFDFVDPEHIPAVITTHGGKNDFVIVSFADTTARVNRDVAGAGGFVVNCDHGGGHCLSPPDVIAAQWTFLKAHPFGVSPEPYASGLPDDFPDSCTIIEP